MLFQHITPFRAQCVTRLVAPLSVGRTELTTSSSSTISNSSGSNATSAISSPKHRTSHLHHSTSSLATSTRPGASLGAISEARSGTVAHLAVNTAAAAAASAASAAGTGCLTSRSSDNSGPSSPTANSAVLRHNSSRRSSISSARHSTAGRGGRQTVVQRGSTALAAAASANELDSSVDFNAEYLMTGTKAKVKLVLTVVSSSHAGSTGGMGSSTVANGTSAAAVSGASGSSSSSGSASAAAAGAAAAGVAMGSVSSCRPTFVGQAIVEVNKDLLYHKHRSYVAVLSSTAAVRLRRLQGEIKAGKQSPLIELEDAVQLPQHLQVCLLT
jgi:hypothetical protein